MLSPPLKEEPCRSAASYLRRSNCALLEPGMTITGPAVIEQLDATTVVGPGWSGAVDQLGNPPLMREDATKS